MLETPLTLKALEIAKSAHEGQHDKAGKPYIEHPIHLAEQMGTEDETCVALLHDVVEDSDISLDDLARAGFSGEVIEAVAALTRTEGMSYLQYIRGIKDNPLATKVKVADLKHNSDLSRISAPSYQDFKRIEKYRLALEMLEEE